MLLNNSLIIVIWLVASLSVQLHKTKTQRFLEKNKIK